MFSFVHIANLSILYVQNYGISLIDDRFFPIFYKFATKIKHTMKYLQYDFKIMPDTQTARDLVAALAGEAGFESFEDYKDGIRGFVQTDQDNRPQLDAALKVFPLADTKVSYSVSEVEDKDWNETWEEKGFDPIRIGNRCIIEDARHSDDTPAEDDSALHIRIEARQAFGTGTHETTRMMVSTLLNMDLTGKRVLDCGCGTGILGIVAAKQGAKEVTGYDIDEWSVRNAEHNAELNGVSMDILEGDSSVLSHVSGLFDVVLANINRNVLLHDMPAFADVMATPAKLLLSGFYEEDVPLLIAKAAELGMHETARRSDGDWCCLVMEK